MVNVVIIGIKSIFLFLKTFFSGNIKANKTKAEIITSSQKNAQIFVLNNSGKNNAKSNPLA
ncbi:MAG: hypothetical protein AB7E37_00320 [Candidatus Altimarinota bacterium]